jgi:hypothetical protein
MGGYLVIIQLIAGPIFHLFAAGDVDFCSYITLRNNYNNVTYLG